MWFVYDHIYFSLSQLIILGFVYNILYNTEDDESAYSFDGIDTVYTTDDDQSIESYDSDTGDDDSVGDEPLGGWNGCGSTKVKLFAQSIKEIDSVIDVDDTSPSATERLGDIFQSQYAKVEEGMKKYNAMKRDSDNSPEFINAPEFKSICEETARLIKQEFPGYNGDLCDFVELFLLGRVSKGTEHRNTGKTQGARMLVDAKLREEKDHFNHQVLLHPKFFLERAHDRRCIESCPSLHEAIKAVLYSSSKEAHLFVNDSLRAFYEPIQHRFLLEVLKALNPNKVIVIRLCRNGLMSPDKNERVIDITNKRQLAYSALDQQLSHTSPSDNVPVTILEEPKQADINKLAKTFETKWDADGKYPDEVVNAFTRGQNYILSEKRAPGFRKTVKNTKTKLREVNPNALLHDISTTEEGSSFVNNGRLDYFGRQTEEHQSDDAAFLLRTSCCSNVTVKDMDGVCLPIENVASAFACFELRKKLGLIPKKTKLQFIFYSKGSSRSAVCSAHEEKLLDAILTNQIGHVVTTKPNRINEDSIVVQTYLAPNVGFHFSKDSGKELMPILRNEAERTNSLQAITNTCNTDVELVEQSYPEVTFDLTFHNLLKKVSFAHLPKEFVQQAEDYNNTISYPAPLFSPSSLDSQHQKQLEECNDEAKKYLEYHPKPSKVRKPRKVRKRAAAEKHVKTIEEMKKDRSNYVLVGKENVFLIPSSDSAVYEHVRKLRRLDKDNLKRLKFEQAADIDLSKMEQAYSQLRVAAEKERLEQEEKRLEQEEKRLEQEKQARQRRLQLEHAVNRGYLVLSRSPSNPSGYTGVTEVYKNDRYTGAVVRVYVAKYRNKHLGQFDSPKDAAMEYALAHFNATK